MSRQYGDGRHYVGFATEIYKRLNRHLNGYGSQVTKRAFFDGVQMKVGRIIQGVNMEKTITEYGPNRYCDICRET